MSNVIIETYPISHLTESEMCQLRELLGFSDNWSADVIKIRRDSPKFIELQGLLVGAGINAAFRRHWRK
jgi:hypothetical protein